MSEIVIDIQNLGKKYLLNPIKPSYSLRDQLTHVIKQFGKKGGSSKKEFWALHDLNIKIHAGERVGIIGRNGAGKTTLLKVISRITPPTTGTATIRGRIGSLLEVGTGFHPELTGRENIFFNGAILGLRKAEIKKQFDAIVAFSGVEQFLETPLKHYSSGMQLRLAFSVAAHLDPEILLIDEVLAVGDQEFQKKCLGKMEEVSQREGRTILFVSHNLDSIRKFCSRALLMERGTVIYDGNTEKVIHEYVARHLETVSEKKWDEGINSYEGSIRLRKVWLHGETGKISSRFDTTENVAVSLDYEILKDDVTFTHGLNLYNAENTHVFSSHDVTSSVPGEKKSKGRYVATVIIPGNLLPEGIFSLHLAIFNPNPLDIFIHQQNVLSFETYTDFTKLNARGDYASEFPGLVRPLLKWTSEKIK